LLSRTIADGAAKTDNTGSKYAIDKTIRAIKDNKKLTFQYFEYDIDAKKQLRRGGHVYSVSPFYIVWAREELFLIANPDSHANLTHFRLAMMTNVEISEESRKKHDEVDELTRDFDLSKYVRESLNMYSGEAIDVKLRCHASILSELVNEFGRNAQIGRVDDEWFPVTIRAADNEGLYRWVMQYGNKVEVLSPKQALESVKNALAAALTLYDEPDT
jgi:predicted DNA-binding transcriptional regulator YafY